MTVHHAKAPNVHFLGFTNIQTLRVARRWKYEHSDSYIEASNMLQDGALYYPFKTLSKI
jgi:hypothetical protein